MTNETTKPTLQQRANEAAANYLESMREDLAALKHAQECTGETEDGEPCTHGNEATTFTRKDGTTGKRHLYQHPEAWHDEDAAREAITAGALSVQVRGGWHTPGELSEAREYELLLGTGGPAMRITGDLDRYSEPENARFEFQDWFEPWTAADLSDADISTLQQWAQHFYFGE